MTFNTGLPVYTIYYIVYYTDLHNLCMDNLLGRSRIRNLLVSFPPYSYIYVAVRPSVVVDQCIAAFI